MNLKEIEELVVIVAKEANTNVTSLSDKIDALRALSPYYAALKKAQARGLDDEEGGTLDEMIAEIEETNGVRQHIQDN
jgi:hypothetical protein